MKDEGVVMDMLSVDKNTLAYISQLGVLHLYDNRVKKDALKFNFGPHRGLVTASCLENKSVIMGTASGYLMIYDLRFNSLSRTYLHSRKGAFSSLSMFKRDRSLPALDHINVSRDMPLLLTAAESGEFEVALWDLTTGHCGMLLALQDELPTTIPYLLEEDRRLVVQAPQRPILLNERLTRPILSTNLQHQRTVVQKYTVLSQKINDVLDHWNHFGTQRPDVISAKKVLCPAFGGLSVPYVITGSSDAILRYWDLRNPRSSKVVAMQDFSSQYKDELLGDVRVVREIERFSKPVRGTQFSSVGLLRSAEREEAFVTRKYLHSDDINDLAIVQGASTYLMSASRDGSVRLWR
jgi:WD40 repeat protein